MLIVGVGNWISIWNDSYLVGTVIKASLTGRVSQLKLNLCASGVGNTK